MKLIDTSTTGVQMYQITPSNWTWVRIGQVSTINAYGRSYICDPILGQIAYPGDGSIILFNVNTLTWIRKSVTKPLDPLGALITQGLNPAACLGGDGKYYSFGGMSSVYIEQWDPATLSVNCFGTMPDVTSGTDTRTGSQQMCCVAVPDQPNLIFVTLNSEFYSYDYAIFDITANPGGGRCNRGAWFNRTSCRNLPNYNADLTLRDCSTCSGNIVLGPGGDPYSNMFTRCHFHQHFTSAFFVRKCFMQLFSGYSWAL